MIHHKNMKSMKAGPGSRQRRASAKRPAAKAARTSGGVLIRRKSA